MPEIPSDFETQEAFDDYLKGYNEGYQIAQYMPELAEQLSSLEPATARLTGFNDGRESFAFDKQFYRNPEWVQDKLTKHEKPVQDILPGWMKQKPRSENIEPEKDPNMDRE